MIRPYRPSDSAAVLDLWLEASIKAHDFVPEAFWREQLDAMREHYLPQSETLVLEEQGQLLGQCHQLKQFSYKYHIISTQISA